jgi:hypothetical protein
MATREELEAQLAEIESNQEILRDRADMSEQAYNEAESRLATARDTLDQFPDDPEVMQEIEDATAELERAQAEFESDKEALVTAEFDRVEIDRELADLEDAGSEEQLQEDIDGQEARQGLAYDDDGNLMPGYAINDETGEAYYIGDKADDAANGDYNWTGEGDSGPDVTNDDPWGDLEGAQKKYGGFDPSGARLENAGLPLNGEFSGFDTKTNVGFSRGIDEPAGDNEDWRVKISLAPGADYFYNDTNNAGIVAPLAAMGGMVFPYLPQVTMSYTARYSEQKLTHSNYASYFYDGSEVQAIQLQGEFTVQNRKEGQYLLAAIYFLRACTKMWFGKDQRAGTPPPMVFLDGFGTHYFPHVPCVVTQFQHTLSPEVDYLYIPYTEYGVNGKPVSMSNSTLGTRVPTSSSISVTLQPIYSRSATTGFSLDDFAAGRLLRTNMRGGFL